MSRLLKRPDSDGEKGEIYGSKHSARVHSPSPLLLPRSQEPSPSSKSSCHDHTHAGTRMQALSVRVHEPCAFGSAGISFRARQTQTQTQAQPHREGHANPLPPHTHTTLHTLSLGLAEKRYDALVLAMRSGQRTFCPCRRPTARLVLENISVSATHRRRPWLHPPSAHPTHSAQMSTRTVPPVSPALPPSTRRGWLAGSCPISSSMLAHRPRAWACTHPCRLGADVYVVGTVVMHAPCSKLIAFGVPFPSIWKRGGWVGGRCTAIQQQHRTTLDATTRVLGPRRCQPAQR